MTCEGRRHTKATRPHVHIGERVVDILGRITPDEGEPISEVESALLLAALRRQNDKAPAPKGGQLMREDRS